MVPPPTFSYITTISLGCGQKMTYIPTVPFVQNNTTCYGVIVPGAGTEFVIDQINSSVLYHRIRLNNVQFLTSAAYSTELPGSVKTQLHNLGIRTAGQKFLTTTEQESIYYFRTTVSGSPSASNVDLSVSAANYYINQRGSSNYLNMNVSCSLLSFEANTGTRITSDTPSAAEINEGVAVDAEGNQILITGGCTGFTASTKGPVLGTYNGGVQVPGYPRDNSLIVSQAGAPGLARWMPYSGALPPAINQSNSGIEGNLSSVTLGPITNGDPNFGYALAVDDGPCVFAVGSPDVGACKVLIYSFGLTGQTLLQTINLAGDTSGQSVGLNTDASILICNEKSGTTFSRINLYKRTAAATWTLVGTIISGVNNDTQFAANNNLIGISKDGCVVLAGSTAAFKTLIVAEDSCDGSWTSSTTFDLGALITGALIIKCCLSANGQYAFATVDTNTLVAFKRESLGVWTKIYEDVVVTAPPLTSINLIKSNYNGSMLFITGNNGAEVQLTMVRACDDEFIPSTLEDISALPLTSVAANSNFTLLCSVDGTDGVYSTSKINQRIYTNAAITTIPGVPSISTVAVCDNNDFSPVLFGDPTNGNIFIKLASASTGSLTTFVNDEFAIRGLTISQYRITFNVNGISLKNMPAADLGTETSRFRNIYVGTNLFLPSKTNDGAFDSGTITVVDFTAAGVVLGTQPNFTTINVVWTRNSNTIFIQGTVAYNTFPALPGSTDVLGLRLGTGAPSLTSAFITTGSLVPQGGAIVGNGLPLVSTINLTNNLTFYENDTVAGTLEDIIVDTAGAAPHVAAAGTISFSITFTVLTS